MRIRMNDSRERRYDRLEDVSQQNTRSGALDDAADYYLRMRGGTPAQPDGAVEQLMSTAVERGSLTPGEIAEILSQPELPVEYSHEWSVGDE